MDELLQQIERLAHANQALTQRLDREHSMRLAAEERIAAQTHGSGFNIWTVPDLSEPIEPEPITLNDVKITVANIEGAVECIDEIERRAHEAEAALEAMRADVDMGRARLAASANAASTSFGALAVHSVCELLAAWGRLVDRNDARVAIADARAVALLDAKCAASGAIGSLVWGNR